MTNKIKLDTGVVKIDVDTTEGLHHVLVFNPNDVLFIEKLHALYQDANDKIKELEKYQEEKGNQEIELDENGIPINITPDIEKTRDANQWMRDKIDNLLGEGTSKAIFGDHVYYGEYFGKYIELINALQPFIKPIRAKKVNTYVKP